MYIEMLTPETVIVAEKSIKYFPIAKINLDTEESEKKYQQALKILTIYLNYMTVLSIQWTVKNTNH